jgi:Protein of unknown function (DUF3237)
MLKAPELTYFCTVTAHVGAIVEVSKTRRYVPILGGHVTGEITGKIGAGFNDYQFVRPDNTLEIQARYVIETDDGAKLYIENNGIRTASDAILEKMRRGEAVDPVSVYFRAIPRFETDHPAYLHLTRSLFISRGTRLPHAVELDFWRIG